jgi:cytoskeletal protein CcmA (bactofilin family)
MLAFSRLFRSAPARPPLPALSLIGDETTIRGETIVGSGDLRVEGTVHADIERDGRVVVAPGGTVHGVIRAASIRVAGTVRGALHADTTLDLTESADVRARLRADELTIASGADFKGDVSDESTPALAADAPNPAGGDGHSGEAALPVPPPLPMAPERPASAPA